MWLAEHTALAREMLANKAPDAEFRRLFGRSKKAAVEHIRWKDDPEYRQSRTADRVVRKSVTKERCVNISIPDRLRREANDRAIAPQTLTGFVFGDPPIGYRAIDRKREQESA
jgi:hypothetical protein